MNGWRTKDDLQSGENLRNNGDQPGQRESPASAFGSGFKGFAAQNAFQPAMDLEAVRQREEEILNFPLLTQLQIVASTFRSVDLPNFSSRILLAVLFVVVALPASVPVVVAGEVALTWNANPEANLAGYIVYYGTVSGQYDTGIDVGNVTSYTVSGLIPGTYYFSLTAYNGSRKESSHATEVSAVVIAPDTQPPVISGAAARDVTYSAATITWATNEAADGQLEYGLSAAYGSMTALDPALVTAHSIPLSSLSAGTTYHCRIRSEDAAGNLAISDDFTFTTGMPPDVTPPSISSVRSSVISNNLVTITWTTNEAANGMIEYGASTDYGSKSEINPLLAVAHSQNLSGLASGTTYHFRVNSRDAAGNLGVSDDYTFTTNSLPDITSGLVAAYAFDEGTGIQAADSSGSSNSATIRKASWTVNAKFGKALSFNGKNSYLTAGVSGLPAVDAPKSISCWLYLKGSANSTQTIIALANATQHASVQQGIKSSKVGVLQYGEGWLVAANPPSSGAWHHFAYTFDGSQHRFFIDGALSSSSTINPQAAPVTSLQMGRWIDGSEYFKGIIDEVRLYSRALSQEEVTAAMNTPIAGMQSAPAVFLDSAQDDSGEEPANQDPHSADADREPAPQSDSLPAVHIRLSQKTYQPGETVTTSACWFSNPSLRRKEIELKAWLVAPGLAPIPSGYGDADGLFTLAAGLDQDFGSVPLVELPDDLPEGRYQLVVRLIDPVTGDFLAEDTSFFALAAVNQPFRHSGQGTRNVDRISPSVLINHFGDSGYAGAEESGGLEVTNAAATSAPIELKVWLEGPGNKLIPIFSLGADRSLILPGGSGLCLNTMASFPAAQRVPPGTYQMRTRILDPSTGQILNEIADTLVIR